MSDSIAVVAGTWGVVMAAAPLLQIWRIVARRSSADISLPYFGVLLVGFVIWLIYGLSIANPALIVPNVVGILVGLGAVAVVLRFRSPATR
jgi:MtN3 and saliva related transmembrane protein